MSQTHPATGPPGGLAVVPSPEQLREQARAVSPGRALATILTLIPWTLGWLAGWAWIGLAWLVLAARAGYRDARTGPAERS
jgi:hypothetical protein